MIKAHEGFWQRSWGIELDTEKQEACLPSDKLLKAQNWVARVLFLYFSYKPSQLLWPSGPSKLPHLEDFIMQISLYKFYRAADSIVRIHRTSSIMRIPSCRFYRAGFSLRVPSCAIHQAHSIKSISSCEWEFYLADSTV